jgi:hypothetical protein
MKRASIFTILGFLLLAVGLSYAEDQEFKGFITDNMCGAKHMMEGVTAKECTDRCVAAGPQYKYALFVTADEKMYVVDDQDKAKEFAGESVVAKGSVSKDGKTIKLSSIARQR